MVIIEVEKPVTTPAIVSHLQYLDRPLLEIQERKILVDLIVSQQPTVKWRKAGLTREDNKTDMLTTYPTATMISNCNYFAWTLVKKKKA